MSPDRPGNFRGWRWGHLRLGKKQPDLTRSLVAHIGPSHTSNCPHCAYSESTTSPLLFSTSESQPCPTTPIEKLSPSSSSLQACADHIVTGYGYGRLADSFGQVSTLDFLTRIRPSTFVNPILLFILGGLLGRSVFANSPLSGDG